MHSAPSVIYPVGRSRYANRLLLILWGLGACCAAAACLRFDGLDWRPWLLASSVVVSSAAVWVGALQFARPAELHFDGQHWSLSGADGPRTAEADVALDLQFLVLVRLAEGSRTRRWVWLDQQAMPERWRSVRRALYSRASPAAPAAVHHPAP